MARFAPALTTALLAIAVYSNITHNEPALDDGWVIFDNPLIRHLENLPRIFREPYNAAGLETTGGLYRPVTTSTYALNYAIGGRRVLGYHLGNIALHLACTLLVLALCGRLARSTWEEPRATRTAWLAAALYAVHPAHVEAVTMMAGRAELLAAVFSLLCLLLLCTRDRARWRLPAALVCLALGVLSKESAAVTPLLFALIAWLTPRAAGLDAPDRLRRLLGLELALCCSVGVYFVLKLLGPGTLGVPPVAQYFQGAPRSVVALTMTRAWAEYLRSLVWPWPLGLDFFYRVAVPVTSRLGWPALGATLLWTSTLGLALLRRARAPLIALGVSWLFVALLPVSNLVPIGAHLAERFLYLPSVGFCFALAAGAQELLELLVKRLGPAARERLAGRCEVLAAVWVAVLFALTWQRNLDWESPLTLWTAEYQRAPEDPTVNVSLASASDARGDFQAGRAWAERAIGLSPGNWAAQVNLGIAAQGLNDPQTAERAFRKAAELAPRASEPPLFFGVLRLAQGRLEEAEHLFAEAEQAAPEASRCALLRGEALYLAGRDREAAEQLARASRLDPADRTADGYLALLALRAGAEPSAAEHGARYGLSTAGLAFECGERLARAQRWPEALANYQLAVRLYPGHSRALYETSRCEERLGQPRAAAESLRSALRISPGYEEARQALARLSAEALPPSGSQPGAPAPR